MRVEQARNLERSRDQPRSAHAALERARQLQSGTAARDLALDTGTPVKKPTPSELLALIEQIVADLKVASGQLP